MLAVAVVNGRPVGIAHAAFQTNEIAWLEGVRVHPLYRGQGIAGKLNLHLTGLAARNGARVARLCTGSKNMASRRHLDKIGFETLKTFQRLETEKPLKNQPSRIARPRKYDARVWRWIRGRPEFDLFKQMYSDGWTWYPLTASKLQRFLNQRGLLLAGRSPCTSCSTFSKEEHRFTLGFAAGPLGEIGDHARYLRYLLSKETGGRVRALVPEKSGLVRVFEEAGYEKSGKILVYEKSLVGRTQIQD